MGNTRNTGYLQNAIKVSDAGAISFMSGSTTLATLNTSGQISGSAPVLFASTASFVANAQTASFVALAQTASFVANAQSASNAVSAQTASFANAFTVASTLTAQTLVVQTITSSVDFVTGSTRFGSLLDNTHVFTGSMSVSGSGTFTGNIGIGVASPGVALDVNGYSKFTGIGINASPTSIGINPNYIRLTNTGGDFYIGQEGNTNGGFFTGTLAYDSVLYSGRSINSIINGVSRMYVSSSGNVGIGTTTPSFLLDVNGSGRFANPSTFGSSTSNGDLTIISNGLPFVIRGRTTYDRPFLGLTWDISPDTGIIIGNVLKFNVSASLGTNSGTTAMAIASDGNIGIGTTSPTSYLSGTKGLSIVDATNASLGLSNGTNLWLNYLSGTSYRIWNNTNSEVMTLLLNGKVGIGETSPDNTYQGLTIKGSDPSLRLKTTGGSGWTWIEFVNSSGTNNFSMGVNQTSPYFGIKAGAGMDSVHFTMNSSGNMGMGEGASTIARLNVNGSTKMNRSFYNWYQGYWTGNSTYWHMKTSMWGGGSPSGNIQYTMSLFKGYMYSYGDSAIREGMYGFHNWVGTIYNPGASGNLFSNVYVSSDGYVVLVILSGSGEAGVTIDWHQAYGYPFVTAQVTAAKLHGSTTGGY